MDKKHLVLVLGMHRSGTSAITRSLKSLGVDLGDRLMDSSQHNPKGFFEDVDFYKLNEKIISVIRWNSVIPFSMDLLGGKNYEEQALDLLRQKFKDSSVLALKDPRFSLLLPFWQPLFKKLNIEVKYILANRNPLNVAHSLAKRNGFSRGRSYYLWLNYLNSSLIHTINEKLLVVDYDNMLSDPAKEIHRMADFLESKVDQSSLDEYANSFLDNELNHYQSSIEDLKSEAPALVIKLYELLLDLASGREVKDVKSYVASLNQDWLRLLPDLHCLRTLEDELHRIGQEKIAMTAELKKLQDVIANKEKEIIRRSEEASLAMNAIIQSRSWRATQCFRDLAGKVRQILNHLDLQAAKKV